MASPLCASEGKVAMFTRVGTIATPRSAKSGIVSSVSPVAWSAEWMAASTRYRSESSGEPVAAELPPPVAPPRLLGDVRHQVVGLDLVGVVADVAARSRDVAARPNDLG